MQKIFALILTLIYLTVPGCRKDTVEFSGIDEICAGYIQAWKQFYPSRAYKRGFIESLYHFEDYSSASITEWIDFNRDILAALECIQGDFEHEDRIDARLLRIQIKNELIKWKEECPHLNSLSLYAGPISRAVSGVIHSQHLLMSGEKYRLVLNRLNGVRQLCRAAEDMLVNGSPAATSRSLNSLERAAEFYAEELTDRLKSWIPAGHAEDFSQKCRETEDRILHLVEFVKKNIVPQLTLSDSAILGREKYARRLKLYTDSELTPEELEKMALSEIETVREFMAEASTEYLKETYPGQKMAEDFIELIYKAMGDMEKNHPASEAEYLQLLRGFAREAEEFVRGKKLVTLPHNQTLSIELAPESSGPMARIGYVNPAPSFHPNPWTTWYLATIPDSFPEQEREDFWRSFNNHFKKFIVIHELFPGHYIQSKIARENPHVVRILFPYGLYSEGWATLCERIALEAGWDNGNKLTRLAQLRKRLENANRAYTSVQAHCNGWTEDQALEFSVQTSLLAPQFAKSLWGRLMSSPMQITSYFLGNLKFTEVYEKELERLGKDFNMRVFMDTILRAGPIPIDEFPELLSCTGY